MLRQSIFQRSVGLQDVFQPRRSIQAAAGELREAGLDRLLNRQQQQTSLPEAEADLLVTKAVASLSRNQWYTVRDEVKRLRESRDLSHNSWKPFFEKFTTAQPGEGLSREMDLSSPMTFLSLAGTPLSEPIALRLNRTISDALFKSRNSSERAAVERLSAQTICSCPFWLSAREASLCAPWLYQRKGQVGVPISCSTAEQDGSYDNTDTTASSDKTQKGPPQRRTFVINAALVPQDDLRDFGKFSKMPGSRSRSTSRHQHQLQASSCTSSSYHRLYSESKWSFIQSKQTSLFLDQIAEQQGYRDFIWLNLQDCLEAKLPLSCKEFRVDGGEAELHDDLRSLITASSPSLRCTAAAEEAKANVFPLELISLVHFFNLSQLIFF